MAAVRTNSTCLTNPNSWKSRVFVAIFILGGFAVLYRGVIAGLIGDWASDDNVSHGFLIVPLALFFAWERRSLLAAAGHEQSILGLGLILGSLIVLATGILGVEFFLTRVSMLGVIAGIVLFVYGWQHLRILAFPIFFLLLMIPIPTLIFNQVAFPLQMWASRFGEAFLSLCQVPVLREGNVIHLANTSLEVAEACSGIRSLLSLFTLGIVYGYFSDKRSWVRVTLALTTIPIAIATNGLRVSGTGIAAHYFGPAAALGFFHLFSAWLLFLSAFVMLFAVHRLMRWSWPPDNR